MEIKFKLDTKKPLAVYAVGVRAHVKITPIHGSSAPNAHIYHE